MLAALGLAAALSVFALSACVTSKDYHMAKGDLPAAVPLDFTAAVPALELRLVAVIVPEGPGAWKQNTRWDEYVVSLTNRSTEPLTGESVALVDLLGAKQVPGTDPWALEKQSETNLEAYARVGGFVLGVGATVGAIELAAVGYGLGGATVSGIFFLVPPALLANIAVVAVMNHQNKKKLRDEFERRRLRLPLVLAPGATVEGSLFFPIVPGPRRLILQGRTGGAPLELMLDLAPLAGLHLKPAAP